MLRLPLTLIVVALAALPAAASASTVSVVDGRITVSAASGEVNVVRITREDIALPVGVWDTALSAGAGCWTAPAVRCGGGSPVVLLGDRDDQLTYADDTTDALIGPASVTGGEGDDTITTALSGDRVDGGAGADTIDGFGGDDVLHGDAGDDRIDGSFDDDTLVGGAGADTIIGGMGDDTIDARDGIADVVRCAEGVDTVEADRVDDVAGDCETVRRPAGPPTERPVAGGGAAADAGAGPGGGAIGASAGPAPRGAPAAGTTAASRGSTRRPGADRRAPRLSVVAARRRGRLSLTVRCDEACRVTAKAGTRTVRRSLRAGRRARLTLPRAARVTLVARDAAGNATRRTVRG